MMRIARLTVLLFLGGGALANPPEVRQGWDQAQAAYADGDFNRAADQYAVLREQSGTSPALEYNLGNALFRSGHPDRAIAAYRRALWMRPGDGDVQANLRQAVRETGAIVPEVPWSRRFVGGLSHRHWRMLSVAGTWLLAGFGSLGLFLPPVRMARAWAYPLLGLILVISFTAVWASHPARAATEAVLTGDADVTARFEPHPDAAPHFALPSGSVTEWSEIQGRWIRIRHDGRDGWVPAQQVIRLLDR